MLKSGLLSPDAFIFEIEAVTVVKALHLIVQSYGKYIICTVIRSFVRSHLI